jgi:hypothetical protein
MESQEVASAVRWLCDGLEPGLPAGVLRSRLAVLERLEGMVVSTKAVAPWFDTALKAGVVTVDHVDVLAVAVGRLKPAHQTLLLGLDAEILAAARTQIPKVFAATLQELADRATGNTPEDRIARQRRDRSGRLYVNADGMGCAYLQTDTDTHAEIETVIETEVLRRLREQRHPDTTPEQLRADVIADLLRGQAGSKTGSVSGVLVITDPTVLTDPTSTTATVTAVPVLNGRPVTPGTARRLLCDTDLHAVILSGEHQPLDVYRLQRLATDAQRAALAAIYRTCPCCDTGFWRCEIHHIDFWEHGGNTNLDLLVPVCPRLHHQIHDQHWRIELDPDRTIRLYQPDGTPARTIPPPGRTDPNAA